MSSPSSRRRRCDSIVRGSLTFERLESRCPLAAGDLDDSFGTNGLLSVPTRLGLGTYDQMEDIAVQPDGKLVLAALVTGPSQNAFVLGRLNPDGTGDASFGEDKFVGRDLNARAARVAVQADGKILAAIEVLNQSIQVYRFHDDGSPDTSFANGGPAVFSSHTTRPPRLSELIIQPDGRIVVVGNWLPPSNNGSRESLVVRFHSDGTLDESFGVNGVVTTRVSLYSDTAESIIVEPNGDLLVAGYTFGRSGVSQTEWDVFVFKLDRNGQLITAFGDQGVVYIPLLNRDQFVKGKRVALFSHSPERIDIVTSRDDATGKSDLAVTRLNANGTIDATFGVDGTRYTTVSDDSDDALKDAILLDSGKVLVLADSNDRDVLVRYNADFSLDQTYAIGGFFSDLDHRDGIAVAEQPDGMTITAVTVESLDHDSDLGLIRVSEKGQRDGPFGLTSIDLQPELSVAFPHSVVIGRDDTIIAAGDCARQQHFYDACMIKRKSDGKAATFGEDGLRVLNIHGNWRSLLRQQSDGKLLTVTYETDMDDYERSNVLRRFNEDGSIDLSFGNQGAMPLILGDGYPVVWDAILQHDGSLLLHMFFQNGLLNSTHELVRINTDGSLDRSFGTAGRLFISELQSHTPPIALVQADGRTLTILSRYDDGLVTDEIRRWTKAGEVDPSWGNTGVTTVVSSGYQGCNDAAFLPDGKILVACSDEDVSRFVRLTADGLLDPQFGTNGTIVHPVASDISSKIVALLVLPSGGWLTVRNASTGVVIAELFGPEGAHQRTQEWQIGEGGSGVTDVAMTLSGDIVMVGTSVVGPEREFVFLKVRGSGERWHPWSNATMRLNVSGGQHQVVSPIDALMVINELHRAGARQLLPLSRHVQPHAFYDVNEDDWVTPQDALQVINFLNQQAPQSEGEAIGWSSGDLFSAFEVLRLGCVGSVIPATQDRAASSDVATAGWPWGAMPWTSNPDDETATAIAATPSESLDRDSDLSLEQYLAERSGTYEYSPTG